MTSQVPGSITEKKEDEGLESPPLHKSSLQLPTGGLRHSSKSKKKVCLWSPGSVIEREMLSLLGVSLLMPSTSNTNSTL